MVAYGDRTSLEHSVQKKGQEGAFPISIEIRLKAEQFATAFTQNTDGANWKWFRTGGTQFSIDQISPMHWDIGMSCTQTIDVFLRAIDRKNE